MDMQKSFHPLRLMDTLLHDLARPKPSNWEAPDAKKLKHMEVPKIRGAFLGVPIIRTIIFWGLYWGSC